MDSDKGSCMKMDEQAQKTDLQKANQAFKEQNFASAIELYQKAAEKLPALAHTFQLNIQLAKRRLGDDVKIKTGSALLAAKPVVNEVAIRPSQEPVTEPSPLLVKPSGLGRLLFRENSPVRFI